MTVETITIQACSDVITSASKRKYFTVTDTQDRKFICFNPSIHYEFVLGTDVTIDYEPGTGDKTPAIKSIVKEEGAPTPVPVKMEPKADTKNRAVALSYAKDLAVAGKIEVDKIRSWAEAFEKYLNG